MNRVFRNFQNKKKDGEGCITVKKISNATVLLLIHCISAENLRTM
jgi:V8-like Glu-specific endopeptidase